MSAAFTLSSVFCEQFVRTTGLAHPLNHGVHVRNQCRHFFHFIPNLTQGERDHRGVV